MGDEKKPSSLRTRIDRTRMTYERKSNPAPIIVGAAFVLVLAIVLYMAAFSTPPVPIKQPNRAPRKELKQPDNPNYGPASGRASMPKTDEQSVYEITENAKRIARDGNIPQAMDLLKGSLGKWPKYDAELYCSMAMCVGENELKLSGAALQEMWAEKAGYYQKALDLVKQNNGKFAYGKHSVRITNLKMVLGVSKQKAGM